VRLLLVSAAGLISVLLATAAHAAPFVFHLEFEGTITTAGVGSPVPVGAPFTGVFEYTFDPSYGFGPDVVLPGGGVWDPNTGRPDLEASLQFFFANDLILTGRHMPMVFGPGGPAAGGGVTIGYMTFGSGSFSDGVTWVDSWLVSISPEGAGTLFGYLTPPVPPIGTIAGSFVPSVPEPSTILLLLVGLLLGVRRLSPRVICSIRRTSSLVACGLLLQAPTSASADSFSMDFWGVLNDGTHFNSPPITDVMPGDSFIGRLTYAFTPPVVPGVEGPTSATYAVQDLSQSINILIDDRILVTVQDRNDVTVGNGPTGDTLMIGGITGGAQWPLGSGHLDAFTLRFNFSPDAINSTALPSFWNPALFVGGFFFADAWPGSRGDFGSDGQLAGTITAVALVPTPPSLLILGVPVLAFVALWQLRRRR
jgi:hypothetical protein